jgi:uncharacterized membrane protein (TIGR02234 family)
MNPRRLRLILLAAGLLAAALVLGAWTQPWFSATFDGVDLIARGQDASPALSGIALAVVALLAALMIAKPALRTVLGVVMAGLGVLAAAILVPLVASDVAALSSMARLIADATGMAGFTDQPVTRTAWPFVALAGGAVMALDGVAIMLTSRRWPVATSKYDADAAKPDTNAGAWDALSEGDDPTTR